MNLTNDLDTEIAFAVLVEKKHNQKIDSKEMLLLIGRLNKALEEISEDDAEAKEQITDSQIHSQFAVY